MKQCPNCSSAVADEAQFCSACGSAVPAAPVAAVATATEPEAPAVNEAPAPKKKISSKLIVMICIAAVLIAAIVFVIVGFATDWFKSPINKLLDAVEKTLTANSMTTEHELDYQVENGFVSVPEDEVRESKYVYDKENRRIASLVVIDKTTYLIVDGKYYAICDEAEYDDDNFAIKLEELEDETVAGMEVYFDIVNAIFSQDEEAIERLLEKDDIDASADDVINYFNTLKKECLGNSEWLEKELGFEAEGNEYSFKFDQEDLMKELLNIAVDCDVIEKSDKNALLDKIEYEVTLKITVTVEKGYISQIKYTRTTKDDSFEAKLKGKYKIEAINETEITEKSVNKVIDRVNAYFDEYYANCAECGVNDKKDSMRHINDKYYCTDCYYEMGYCDDCGDFIREEDLTRIDYNDLCADCYKNYKEEYYSSCIVCEKEGRKSYMYQVNDDWYCSSCYYDRKHCADCDKFVVIEDMVSISYNYLVCTDCYEIYKVDHTCDQCSAVVGLDYLCPYHDTYDKCDGCGDMDYLNYHVVKKQNLCYSCAQEPIQ